MTIKSKYERPRISIEKQLRRSEMTIEEKRSRRKILRIRTGFRNPPKVVDSPSLRRAAYGIADYEM